MNKKKIKGKQKIDIKKIENDKERSVTLTKRRSRIYTKLSELSVRCGADVGFFVHSDSGKPYTFGNPSFDTVARRFLNGNHPEGSTSSSSIVDGHKKEKMEELCKPYNSLVEKADAEEEKCIIAAAEAMPVDKDSWWKVDPKDDGEAAQLLARFEGLYVKLLEDAERKAKNNQ